MMDYGGGWLLMWIAMMLFWAGLICAVVLAVRYLGSPPRPPATKPGAAQQSPEDVLARRYAGGEIDDEEYRRRVSLLREHRAAG